MRSIPYRWLLPPAQLILFILLIWFGCPYKQTWMACMEKTSELEGKQASGLGLVFEELDFSDQPYFEQLADGINLPALLIGGLFAELIHELSEAPLTGARRELLWHGFTALLIPFLWYFVGKSIDEKSKKPRRICSKLLRAGAIVGLALLCIIAVLFLASFFLFEGWPLYLYKILCLVWITAGIRALLVRVRPIRAS